jgi:hypothetical protein
MNSNDTSDLALPLDLERDLPTTPDDVQILRRLRRDVPSWLTLSAEQIEALIPEGVLARRPATPDGRPPFCLD